MRNIKLVMEYDGTNYAGWQRQKNAISIQGVLEDALKGITGCFTEAFGSSRTDAGVHAKGFVCNFFTENTIPGDRFSKILNSKLPKDIIILSSEDVEESFHARYSSTGKRYSYTILNRELPSAIYRNYVYHFNYQLNIDNMIEASKDFIGKHDFTAFKSNGSSVKTSVRTINQLEIVDNKEIIQFIISGDGFLYNMVRIIVGTLLKVGVNKIKPEDISKIILSKSRHLAGPCVPASGLCLEEVFYD